MKRADDFAERRKHIANLTDQELYDRFWALTEQVVAPLLELGRRNTTPSVERAVLLRMGISSLETQKIVEGCMDHSLMSHGAGHVSTSCPGRRISPFRRPDTCWPRGSTGMKPPRCSRRGSKYV